MAGDILYKREDMVFSYRVSGVLIRDGRILLQKPPDDGYAFIGGHVSALETAEEALTREWREELHADIRVGPLLAVGEVFFPWGRKPCHQIGLYFSVELADMDQIPLSGAFRGFDQMGGERIDLEFCWVQLSRLSQLMVYPQELVPHLLAGRTEVFHFVSRQLEG